MFVWMFHRFQSVIFTRSHTHTSQMHILFLPAFVPPTHTLSLTHTHTLARSVSMTTVVSLRWRGCFTVAHVDHYIRRFPGDGCLVTGRIGGGWWVRRVCVCVLAAQLHTFRFHQTLQHPWEHMRVCGDVVAVVLQCWDSKSTLFPQCVCVLTFSSMHWGNVHY